MSAKESYMHTKATQHIAATHCNTQQHIATHTGLSPWHCVCECVAATTEADRLRHTSILWTTLQHAYNRVLFLFLQHTYNIVAFTFVVLVCHSHDWSRRTAWPGNARKHIVSEVLQHSSNALQHPATPCNNTLQHPTPHITSEVLLIQ